jgi:hypothetical protein
MVHLRIVAPPDKTDAALEVLDSCPTVINVILLREAAHKPHGDVILCDVAREDASVVIEDLTGLGIHRDGSIAIELIDTALSHAADAAEKLAEGLPSDAVIWEEVTEHTSESASISAAFLCFNGARGPDRGRRHLPRQPDPHRRRDGRRPRVRAHRMASASPRCMAGRGSRRARSPRWPSGSRSRSGP